MVEHPKVGMLVVLDRPDNGGNVHAKQRGVIATVSDLLEPKKGSKEPPSRIAWVTFADGLRSPCHQHEITEVTPE